MSKFTSVAVIAAGLVAVAPAYAAPNHAVPNAGVTRQLPPQQPPVATPRRTKELLQLDYEGLSNTIIRSTNVSSVTNPSTGIFCITPTVAVNAATVYPMLSIEWGDSSGFALLAYWKDTTIFTDCSAGQLEVTTYDFNAGGTPVLSQKVAFDLVVFN
jgi:hypothetical protein